MHCVEVEVASQIFILVQNLCSYCTAIHNTSPRSLRYKHTLMTYVAGKQESIWHNSFQMLWTSHKATLCSVQTYACAGLCTMVCHTLLFHTSKSLFSCDSPQNVEPHKMWYHTLDQSVCWLTSFPHGTHHTPPFGSFDRPVTDFMCF
jgi:hypothetical protein